MTDNIMGRTTIVVDTSTRDKLRQLGAKGETYELMQSYEKWSKK